MPSSKTFNLACYIQRYPDLQFPWMAYGRGNFFGYAGDYTSATKKFTAIVDLNRAAVLASPDVGYTAYSMPRDAQIQFNKYGQTIEHRVAGCDLPGTLYDTAFNASAYLARYPDLRQDPNIVANPYKHYQTIGQSQGRIPGFEILNENSPDGLTTPGTTVYVSNGANAADVIQTQIAASGAGTIPGDGVQVLNQNGAPVVPGTNTTVAGSVMAWIQSHELLTAAIAGGGVFVVYELTKKKKKKVGKINISHKEIFIGAGAALGIFLLIEANKGPNGVSNIIKPPPPVQIQTPANNDNTQSSVANIVKGLLPLVLTFI